MIMSVQTTTLPQADVDKIALVGKIVTFPGSNGQFKVHSVEGPTWYAFDQDGETVVDLGLTKSLAITQEPLATLLPTWAKIGQGFSETVRVGMIRRGVNLTKSWI
jgi:hypothetical protein